MTTQNIQPGVDCSFSVALTPLETAEPGFNRHGVKLYDDGSIDIIYRAMEPGVRRGISVTDQFLDRVATNFSRPIPLMLDHSGEQLKQVGSVNAVKFSDGYLRVVGHIPNTGNSVKSDVIADLSYDPPAITDGSVRFARDIKLAENDAGQVEFVDGELLEFSLTPFPAGYDEGGLSPAFAQAVDTLFYEAGDGPVQREWDEGDVVQWQAVPNMIGAVTHIDTDRQVAMVSLHNEDGNKLLPTGYTVTAGYDDVVPYMGTATPVSRDELSDDRTYSRGDEANSDRPADSRVRIGEKRAVISDFTPETN